MANIKISALTAASAMDGTELIPVVQGGTTKKATQAQVTGTSVAASGSSLAWYGLSGSTTDIKTIFDAAVAAGVKHIVVPYSATAWPALTKITLSDVWVEFEAGARISFNHADSGMDLTRCRLSNASFTSIYTGPSTVGDATSSTYAYPARGVVLRDSNVVDGSYYHEYATVGIEFAGAHNRVTCGTTFANMLHQRGWAHAIHGSTTSCFDNRVSGPVYAHDCDRGLEFEDGAYDCTFEAGGYLKNIYPKGYASSASAVTYETYTFVLDGHAHSGTGGVQGIAYNGIWTVENCGGGVTFIRSTGSTDADLPRACSVGDVRFVGRGLSTGYEDLAIQGYNHRVGRCTFTAGAGIAGTSFHVKGYTNTTGCVVAAVQTSDASPIVFDTDAGLTIGERGPLFSATNRTNRFFIPTGSGLTPSTAATLGNGTLRLVPAYLPFAATIDQIGADITSGGDTRSVTDGVLNSTTTITSATASFVAGDVGKLVTGTGIPPGTWIASVTNSTTAVLSAAASATASGVSLAFSCVVRLGCYADAFGLPGSPLIDALVDGSAIATPMTTITAITLQPNWYWWGGAVQGVITTQPTVRTTPTNPHAGYPILGTAAAALIQNAEVGHAKGSVTVALPAFGSTPSPTTTAPRLCLRLAA